MEEKRFAIHPDAFSGVPPIGTIISKMIQAIGVSCLSV
jgi:hypothetical protein